MNIFPVDQKDENSFLNQNVDSIVQKESDHQLRIIGKTRDLENQVLQITENMDTPQLESLLDRVNRHNVRYAAYGFAVDSIGLLNLLDAKREGVPDVTIDCTYNKTQEELEQKQVTNVKSCILDFAHTDPKRRTLYALDGSGHDNALMHSVLNSYLKAFNKEYAKAFDAQQKNFVSIDAAKDFVQQQLIHLASEIMNDPIVLVGGDSKMSDRKRGMRMEDAYDPQSNMPSFSFAQEFNIQGQIVLVTANFGDTFFAFVDRSKNSVTWEKPNGATDGFCEGHVPGAIRHKVLETPIEVIGFSDGVGEFVTAPELKQIILNNESSADIMRNIKRTILERGSQLHDPVKLEIANTSAADIKEFYTNSSGRLEQECYCLAEALKHIIGEEACKNTELEDYFKGQPSEKAEKQLRQLYSFDKRRNICCPELKDCHDHEIKVHNFDKEDRYDDLLVCRLPALVVKKPA